MPWPINRRSLGEFVCWLEFSRVFLGFSRVLPGLSMMFCVFSCFLYVSRVLRTSGDFVGNLWVSLFEIFYDDFDYCF